MKRFLLFAVAATLLSACVEEVTNDRQDEGPIVELTLRY